MIAELSMADPDPRTSAIPWKPLPQCQCRTRSRLQCRNKAGKGLSTCGIKSHREQEHKIIPFLASPPPEKEEKKSQLDIAVHPWTRSQGEVVLRPIPTPKDGPGWIYVFSMPGSKDGRIRSMYKIGLSKRIPEERVTEQHQNDYGGTEDTKPHILSKHYTTYCRLAESAIHSELSYWRRTVSFPPHNVVHKEWVECGYHLVEAVVIAKCRLVSAWYPDAVKVEEVD